MVACNQERSSAGDLKLRKGDNMSTPRSELYVITSAKRMADYILTLTEKCPKKFRYSYLIKIENVSLDIVTVLYEANGIKLGDSRRGEKQSEAKIKMKILDFLSEQAMLHCCFSVHQYEVISSHLNDCVRALDKWVVSDQTRIGARLQ